jgi:hypothetical protein
MKQRSRPIGWHKVCVRDGAATTVSRLVLRFIDVLIVPWLLGADILFAYLAARALACLVPLLLAFLHIKALPQLVYLSQLQQNNAFRAAAARINLGYLMVCGSAALLVLLVARHLIIPLGISNLAFSELVIWLVIGQSAPVLFGATRLLMQATGRSIFCDLLSCLTSAFFLISLILSTGNDGVFIAQTFAAAQMAHACICALLLTQCGVWPGLTALFHNELRIF